METDEPVFKGYLFLPPSGKILKKTWQKKYCVLYKRSSSGIARLEIFESEMKTDSAKILTLEDVIKIAPKSSNVINIVTKNADMEFGTTSDEILNNWFDALKSVAFPGDDINSIEQDNDLYCSANEGVFCVKLHPSDASQRCNLPSKKYILVVANSALQLRSEDDNTLLYTWPFSYIRKYGYKGGKFNFEAGRKCTSGEGIFYLEHPNHNEIYRCLALKMKNMKQLLTNESTTSSIDCGDPQFQAAMNMEPGSRNPLPPSISVPSSFQNGVKPSLGLNFSSMSCLDSVMKPVPKKPPRKSLTMKSPKIIINATHEYNDVNAIFSPAKYDTVESRMNAWKTMGVQDPSHFEKISPTQDNIYCSWGNPSCNVTNEIQPSEKISGPAIITEPITSSVSQYYDCLQHFGSSNTLNTNSGYKKIVPHANKSMESIDYSEEGLPDYNDEYTSWSNNPLTKSMSEVKLTEKAHAPTVISEPIQSSDQDYDRLNFFGQSSGPTANSDYKQVISSSPVPPVKVDSFNLYEEVNIMESVRSADDSHLGYARIKKDSVSNTLKEVEDDSNTFPFEETKEETQRVAHQFQNHQPYAVISKPKRV